MPIERQPIQPGEGQQPFGGAKNKPQTNERPIHGPPATEPAEVGSVPAEQVSPARQELGVEIPANRTSLDDESLKQLLRDQMRAYNEGRAEDIGGPFSERERHLLGEISEEILREWARQRRIERGLLKSQLGKQEFNRRRKHGDFHELG